MATTEQIDTAAKTDEELHRRGVAPSILSDAQHVLAGADVPLDPDVLWDASLWLRSKRPDGWETFLEMLDLPEVGRLAGASDDPEPEQSSIPVEKRPRPGKPRPDWSWQDAAACRGEDLVLFFGPDGERQAEKVVRERKAKAICAQCPTRNSCLDYAVSRPEKYGTWGGLNEDERASERRRRARRASMAGVPAAKTDPDVVADEKQCSACRVVRPASDFLSDVNHSDGLTSWCKGCHSENKENRRREAKEAVA